MTLFFNIDIYDNELSKAGFLMFQTVFCATTMTIVSEVMAERTKFSTYICYSIPISTVTYPISGHWTWSGGWLRNGDEGSFMINTFGTTFHDYAGSMIVHPVGKWGALIDTAVAGPVSANTEKTKNQK